MTDDVIKLAKLVEDIARGERTLAEAESAANRSPQTDRAIAALRYSLRVQKAELSVLEKKIAQGA
jgi:hypothetical protein